MYLSEEKKSEIRKLLGEQKSRHGQISPPCQTIPSSESRNKISQILFDARDGKEVFTPFTGR